ncbi:MAG: PilZ domain-containing protein [Myxococcaceae bacterium]
MGSTLVYGASDKPPRSRRVRFVRPVEVRAGEGQTRRMVSSNLSEGGMFLRTPEILPQGTALEIALEAQGRSLRFAAAEVVFALRPEIAEKLGCLPGVGVRFTDLQQNSKALVDHLMSVCPPAPSESSIRIPRQQLERLSEDPFDVPLPKPEGVPNHVRRHALIMLGVIAVGMVALIGIQQYRNREELAASARLPPPAKSVQQGAEGQIAAPASGAVAAQGKEPASATQAKVIGAPSVQTKESSSAEQTHSAPLGSSSAQTEPGAPQAGDAAVLRPTDGVVSGVRLTEDGDRVNIHLEMRGPGELNWVSMLRQTPRLAIDIKGTPPSRAIVLPLSGRASQVQIRPTPAGLRLLLTLKKPPAKILREGTDVILVYGKRP